MEDELKAEQEANYSKSNMETVQICERQVAFWSTIFTCYIEA